MGAVRERLGESVTAFKDVFGNADLRRLELAWTSVIVGWWAYLVAVNVFAYEADGASAVGLLVLIRLVPAAFVAPFAATLADRYRRDRVMLSSNLVRALLITVAGFGVLLDVTPWVVYGLAAGAMLVGTPFRPALAAITPSVARSPGELTATNAVTSTVESLAFFAGPALAGLLFAIVGTGYVFFVTAFGFALSAFFVSRLDIPREAERSRAAERSSIVAETLVGFRTVGGDSRLRILIGLFSAQTLVAGIFVVLVVVMAIELLGMGKSGVGYLNAAFGVGALIGSILAVSLASFERLSPPFIFGVVMWGLPLVLIGIWPEPAFALVLLATVGVGNAFVSVSFFTLIQRAIQEEVLARVFGVIQMLWILTVGLGGLVAVPLLEGFGVETALIVTGVSLPVLVALLGPPLLRIDAAATAPGPELSLLRSTPIFAPLPGTALEHVAARLVPLRFEPGSIIVQQGDPGDRFYILVEGEVEIRADGKPISELGPGGYFGEIALIRDVPRTATVTARTPVVLYGLEREDFLAAVTGHAPSARAADDVVGARLASVPATGGPLPET